MATAVPAMRHMADPRWADRELPSWHWPRLGRPAELAEMLDQAG
jgi:hypothetical protein